MNEKITKDFYCIIMWKEKENDAEFVKKISLCWLGKIDIEFRLVAGHKLTNVMG